MTRFHYKLTAHRVALGWAVSRMLLLCWATLAVMSSPALAHEVQPSVADLIVDGATITLDLEATIEPLIAGADLDGLLDTDSSALSDEVDRLRALSPAALEQAFRDYFPTFQEQFSVMSGNTDVTFALESVTIPDVGNAALPRTSEFVMTGTLPDGGAPVTVQWDAQLGALVLRQMGAGPEAYTGYLQNGDTSDAIPRSGASTHSFLQAFVSYIPVGFEHIVPLGLDHILFVLGLFFLSIHLGPLLWQVSAFTAAHTVTLALAALGIVSIPASIVEPLIAASIVYVGVENVLSRGMSPWRPVVVLCFGLLHGLGFAGVLSEYGLGANNFAAKLIGFNIGVELGQLAVIAVAFLAVGLWFGRKPWYDRYIANPASIAIAIVGAYWFLERTIL